MPSWRLSCLTRVISLKEFAGWIRVKRRLNAPGGRSCAESSSLMRSSILVLGKPLDSQPAMMSRCKSCWNSTFSTLED